MLTGKCPRCGFDDRDKRGYCKECSRESTRRFRQTDKGKETNAACDRKRHGTRSDYNKRWRQENSIAVKEYKENYNARNPGVLQRCNVNAYFNHKPNYIQASRNRRARVRGAEGSFTKEEFQDMCNYYENRCLCCGADKIKLVADHVKPLSKGGSNSIENIQPLCNSCNAKKHVDEVDYR